MRPDEQRTPLAVLRKMLGFQRDRTNLDGFADLLAMNQRTLQAIELGERKLTHERAAVVAAETGVSLKWLILGDAEQPPVNWAGRPYTRADFDHWRKLQRSSPSDHEKTTAADDLELFAAFAVSALSAQKTCSQFVRVQHAIMRAADVLAKEFNDAVAQEILEPIPEGDGALPVNAVFKTFAAALGVKLRISVARSSPLFSGPTPRASKTPRRRK